VKLSSPILGALIGLIAVVVVCSTVLVATSTAVPPWFEQLAILLTGGVLGGYTPVSAPSGPTAPSPGPPTQGPTP